MNDEVLKVMSKDDANKFSNNLVKRRWIELHNSTANLYYFDYQTFTIKDVDPSGWWF